MTLSRTEPSCTFPTTCRKCQDPILWVEWPSGKKMPIDALPSKWGTIVVTHRKSENKLLAERRNPDGHQGRKYYVCHWDTCPNAHD